MNDLRNIIDVIDQILKVVPAEEREFTASLKRTRESASYCAPERMFTLWRRLSFAFTERFEHRPADGWGAAAADILQGPPRPSIPVDSMSDDEFLEATKGCKTLLAAAVNKLIHLGLPSDPIQIALIDTILDLKRKENPQAVNSDLLQALIDDASNMLSIEKGLEDKRRLRPV